MKSNVTLLRIICSSHFCFSPLRFTPETTFSCPHYDPGICTSFRAFLFLFTYVCHGSANVLLNQTDIEVRGNDLAEKSSAD